MGAQSNTRMEEQIDAWRMHVRRHASIDGNDGEELEGHLRDAIDDLRGRGLNDDEAFIVAVRRLGAVDAISREFAREHSDRLWKQLVIGDDADRVRAVDGSTATAVGFAIVSAAAVRTLMALLSLLEYRVVGDIGITIVAALAAYFLVRRRAGAQTVVATCTIVLAGALTTNLYPFNLGGMTFVLHLLHLAVVAWFAVGVAYVNGAWRSQAARMDFLRFTGEWAIYLILICLGGGVLAGVTTAILFALGVPGTERLVTEWIAPMGFAAATVIAAWLVEAKQSVVENLAPVLTRIFTPLFTVLLVALVPLTALYWQATLADRNLLIAVNALLIVVVSLVLYTVSARTPAAPANWLDRCQVVMVAAAVALDLLLLVAVSLRIGEYGITANKLATVGLNILLLVNLSVSLVYQARYLRGRTRYAEVGGWQTAYLPVWFLWASFVAFIMPPLFSFA